MKTRKIFNLIYWLIQIVFLVALWTFDCLVGSGGSWSPKWVVIGIGIAYGVGFLAGSIWGWTLGYLEGREDSEAED